MIFEGCLKNADAEAKLPVALAGQGGGLAWSKPRAPGGVGGKMFQSWQPSTALTRRRPPAVCGPHEGHTHCRPF